MKLVYDDRVATYKDVGQEVSFSIPDGILGVAVSGGLDSTALAYLICRYITDLKLEDKIKVIPVHEYKPFININKKMIASLHKFLNIDKEYITKTWTCTYFAKDTKTFTEPCGNCYHCWEKKWAFGSF